MEKNDKPKKQLFITSMFGTKPKEPVQIQIPENPEYSDEINNNENSNSKNINLDLECSVQSLIDDDYIIEEEVCEQEEILEQEPILINKKKVAKKYCALWENKFKWIKPSNKGNEYFRCLYCTSDLKGGLTEASRHNLKKIHLNNELSYKINNISAAAEAKPFKPNHQKLKLDQLAKENEIKLSMLLAEHNIAISNADHIIDLIKSFNPLSIQKMKCKRNKATSIIENVIGKTGFENIIDKMRNEKFSILIDESTDCSTTKHLVIVARILINREPKDCFVTLLEVNDCTAEGLFNYIKNFFMSNNIDYKKNLVGFAADGASVMVGSRNSVVTRLRQEIPNIFIQPCICHSLALCAAQACEKLPMEVENMMKNVFLHFRFSSKRQSAFSEIQEALNIPQKKLLNTCRTRWLALDSCIKRFLEQLPAIRKYFADEAKSARNPEVSILHKQLENQYNILYLEFLREVLPHVTLLNLEFQSEKSKIQFLYRKMESLYRTILDYYIDSRYLQGLPIKNVGYDNPVNFVSLEKIHLGPVVDTALNRLNFDTKNQPNIKIFKTQCQNFLISLAGQIKSRFPFERMDIEMLKYIEFIDATSLIDIKGISPLIDFLGMDADVNKEYAKLRRDSQNIDMSDNDRFWLKIENYGGYENIVKIRNLLKLYPHSTASCERVFSSVSQNKTKIRNRMSTNLLNGILNSKNYLQITNSNCHNMKITKQMMDNFNSANMY